MRKISLCTVFFCLLASYAYAAGITKYPALNGAQFWQKNFPAGTATVLNKEQLRTLNKEIVEKSPSVYDLAQYPASVAGEKVKGWIKENDWLFKKAIYVKKQPIQAGYRQLIVNELALDAIPPSVEVRRAVTISRTNLRAMPTNEGWFYSASDSHFDRLQNTALDPGEAVAVLHKSKSGNFLFVQTRNYRGWLPVWTVAFAEKALWLEYAEPKEFLVVTANKMALGTGGGQKLYQMGARILVKIADKQVYTVRLPLKKSDGMLGESTMQLPADLRKYNLGYLPYTRNNVIAQAFKFLGDPYGWGGLKDSVDCSSFINDIYRTVGVYLPRNADEQEETAGVRFVLNGLPQESRQAMFAGLSPGDVLFMPGHTMLYLGSSQGAPYAIHALGMHSTGGRTENVMQVVVSDLSLQNSGGKTFFMLLTSALSYR